MSVNASQNVIQLNLKVSQTINQLNLTVTQDGLSVSVSPVVYTSRDETDPVFQAWLATNPLNGFITQETDPIFQAWLATNPLNGFITQETDPIFQAWISDIPIGENIYGIKNSVAKRIDTLLTDNYLSGTVLNSGTTLANIGSFFGGSFSGTHTAYGSILNTIPASKIVSNSLVGSFAGYIQQIIRGITNTLNSKIKTESYFSLANSIAPTTSRSFIGFKNYALSIGNYNPSNGAILGFLNDDGEEYLKLSHRISSGIVQSISLGNLFPARFSNQEHVYQCCFYLLGNHKGMATIRDLITGNYYESPILEVYQVNANGFYFSVFSNNNTSSEIVEPIFTGHLTRTIYGL